MRHFHASAVERRTIITNKLESHPMETGWASEAIFFLIVEEITQGASLKTEIEISADGINWIKEGTSFPLVTNEGHYFARVSHFGNWLRVSGNVEGSNSQVKVSVHLHLKE